MRPPVIGYQSLIYDQRDHLAASSEDTGWEVERLADLQLGTSWAPTWAAWLAGTVYVYLYSVLGQLLPVGWYFRDWSLGASAVPDGWTLSGASAAVARGTTTPRIGSYTAELTRAGTDCCLYQAVVDATALRGRQVSAGAWLTATVADRGYVAIYDGTTRWTSYAHAGSGGRAWISVSSGRISSTATSVRIELWVKNGDTTVTFEGPWLGLGAVAASTPHAVSADYVGLAGHTLGSGGSLLQVQYSNDNFSTATNATGQIEPASDAPVMRRFTAATAGWWRLAFSGVGNVPRPTVAVAALGMSLAMPRGVLSGIEPITTRSRTESARTEAGAPLGRLVLGQTAQPTLTAPYVTEAELAGVLAGWRVHAHDRALPFLVQWDPEDHADEAWWCWTRDDGTWGGPLRRTAEGLAVAPWSLELEREVTL